MIEFDLNGRELALDETVVRELRAKALAGAGSSSTLNDLAVILSRALSEQKSVTLRRAESRALEQLLNTGDESSYLSCTPAFERRRSSTGWGDPFARKRL